MREQDPSVKKPKHVKQGEQTGDGIYDSVKTKRGVVTTRQGTRISESLDLFNLSETEPSDKTK